MTERYRKAGAIFESNPIGATIAAAITAFMIGLVVYAASWMFP